MIRATQGHSIKGIDDDKLLTPIEVRRVSFLFSFQVFCVHFIEGKKNQVELVLRFLPFALSGRILEVCRWQCMVHT
jgi:hypothetical protein